MNNRLQPNMQWNTQTPVPVRGASQMADFWNIARTAMPSGARGLHPITLAANITPGTYNHGPPIMGSHQFHMPSPPTSQPEGETSQMFLATQQEMINDLRDEKDRLVSDKERLMNDKDKLVNEKINLVDETRSILKDKERTLKDANDLLTSKSVLWQDCYRAVGERDEEIKTLKQAGSARDEEIKRLKEANSALDYANKKFRRKLEKERDKNVELAQALEEIIEKGDNGGDDAVEDEDEDLPLARPINEIIYKDFLREKQVHDLDNDVESDDIEGEDARAVRLEAKAKLQELLQANATPVSRVAKVERTSSWLESVDQPADPQTESRRQLEEIFGGAAEVGNDNGRVEDTEPPAKRMKLSPQAPASTTPHCDSQEQLPSQSTDVTRPLEVSCEQPRSRPETPPPPEKCSVVLKYGHALATANPPVSEARTQSPSPVAEEPEQSPAEEAAALLAKLQSDLLVPKHYTVRPIIRHPDSADTEYGELAELAPKTLHALFDTFDLMQKKHLAGKCSKTPIKVNQRGCGYQWGMNAGKGTNWYRAGRHQFTCYNCYSNRRACIMWHGSGRWELLPLPPQFRSQKATYKDDNYYVRGAGWLRASDRDLWDRPTPQRKQKMATDPLIESL